MLLHTENMFIAIPLLFASHFLSFAIHSTKGALSNVRPFSNKILPLYGITIKNSTYNSVMLVMVFFIEWICNSFDLVSHLIISHCSNDTHTHSMLMLPFFPTHMVARLIYKNIAFTHLAYKGNKTWNKTKFEHIIQSLR